MGVIYVVAEAAKLGFWNGHPDWSNLGQGQPEVGPIDGAPPRFSKIELDPNDHAYGPVGGTDELRQRVAEHYNRLYRKGKRSQYTKDNVTIAAGGRLVLTRVFATLGSINLGYQLPDYTAYEDMIDYHRHRITPFGVVTTVDGGFVMSPPGFESAIGRYDLNAFLLSNPCNPTGQLVQGEALAKYVDISRRNECALILDEFYSHYVYTVDGKAGVGPVSAAEYVDDVESDRVVVIDGLTKSYRYPGLRVGWALGPADIIERMNRAASAIDGGPGIACQKAALEILEPDVADRETNAVRTVFTRKRNIMLQRLRAMGIRCEVPPSGTFYVWADIGSLREPLNDADVFFRKALERKVMTVPGRFFDVNPGKERSGASPYKTWVRFSFGPPEENMVMGLERLGEMVVG